MGENEKLFSYERMSTSTHFESEAKVDTEMAYNMYIVGFQVVYVTLTFS